MSVSACGLRLRLQFLISGLHGILLRCMSEGGSPCKRSGLHGTSVVLRLLCLCSPRLRRAAPLPLSSCAWSGQPELKRRKPRGRAQEGQRGRTDGRRGHRGSVGRQRQNGGRAEVEDTKVEHVEQYNNRCTFPCSPPCFTSTPAVSFCPACPAIALLDLRRTDAQLVAQLGRRSNRQNT